MRNIIYHQFDGRLLLVQGDITKQKVDVIVNAANSYLKHGGGVAKVIAQAAGDELIKESKDIIMTRDLPVPTGKCVVTTAGNLDAKKVIHAVGPIWSGGHEDEDKLLESAVACSLNLAESMKMKSIAFPAISTGIYGYPIDKAAVIIINTMKDFLEDELDHLREIRIVLFTKRDLDIFANLLEINR